MSLLDAIASGGRTSGLDVAKAGTQGQMAASKLADASLSRKVKQSEYEDYLDNAEVRRQKRDEFTSEEGQEARATKREAGMSTDEQTIATAKKQEFWDLAGFTMDESTSQEDYNGVYSQIDPGLREKAKLTGVWANDKEKVRKVLDTTKESVKHIQDLEKLSTTAKGKGASKLHKPSAPPLLKDPAAARIYVSADPELADLARTWSTDTDVDNIDNIAVKVQISANAAMSESFRIAQINSSVGRPWDQLQVRDAMAAALEQEKSYLVDLSEEGNTIKYLPTGEAIQQRNDWIATQGERQAIALPSMRSLTPQMFRKRMNDIYENYMLELYRAKKLNMNESAAYAPPTSTEPR